MVWRRIGIIIICSVHFLLFGCWEEETEFDYHEIIFANKVWFSLNNLDFIPSKCVLEVTQNDYLYVARCEYVCLYPEEYNVCIGFDDANKRLFSSEAKFHIILNDSLHFYIEDVFMKADTVGKDEKDHWIINNTIDSYTLNGRRMNSKFPDALYSPMSLGLVPKKRK